MNAPTTARLSSKAVIATLNVGAWRTVKRHAAETAAENARHGLRDEARVDVKICNHPALEEIARLHTEARAEHYRLTLPAADKGLRLLPAVRQFEHSALMQSFGVKIDTLVDLFLADPRTGFPLTNQAWVDFSGWRVNYDQPLLGLCALVEPPAAAWSS